MIALAFRYICRKEVKYMQPSKLPERTVERLSEYRRTLLNSLNKGVTHIYSHNLASIHGITAVQVRRDLMLIGFSSNNKKGYNVRELIDFIGGILDSDHVLNVAVIGMGNLASAITAYFNGKRSKLRIVAAFDVSDKKVGKVISSIPCYHIDDFKEQVRNNNINIVILTLPTQEVDSVCGLVIESGIKGVLNFTSKPLTFPEEAGIYVEDYDIITLLEKVAYYTKG